MKKTETVYATPASFDVVVSGQQTEEWLKAKEAEYAAWGGLTKMRVLIPETLLPALGVTPTAPYEEVVSETEETRTVRNMRPLHWAAFYLAQPDVATAYELRKLLKKGDERAFHEAIIAKLWLAGSEWIHSPNAPQRQNERVRLAALLESEQALQIFYADARGK